MHSTLDMDTSLLTRTLICSEALILTEVKRIPRTSEIKRIVIPSLFSVSPCLDSNQDVRAIGRMLRTLHSPSLMVSDGFSAPAVPDH